MRCKWLLPLLGLLVSPLDAVFTDDAFNADYHQALLGIPLSQATLFHKPQSSSNASLLYTISDKAVLGAINPRDGSLVWRQALAGRPVENVEDAYLAVGDADGRITSGYSSSISSWDATSGRLNWEHKLEKDLHVKALRSVPNIAAAAENVIQDIVAVAGPAGKGSAASVIRLAGDGSVVRWIYTDKSAGQDTSFYIATSPSYVYYITKTSGVMSGTKAGVVVIDMISGKEVKQYSVAIDAEAVSNDGSLSVGSGTEHPFLISAAKPYKSLKVSMLDTGKGSTIALEDKGEEIEDLTVHYVGRHGAATHLLVHVHGKTRHWAEVFHLNPKTGEAKKAYSLPATMQPSVFDATAVGQSVYFTRVTEDEVSLFSESHGHIGRWSRAKDHLQSLVFDKHYRRASHAATEVSSKGAGNVALRVALTSSAGGLSLIRNGEQAWLRPEQLAYITKAVWSDDVEDISLAQKVEIEASSNPITAYISRVTRHMLALKDLPAYLLQLPGSILKPHDDTEKSARNKLAGSQLLLASTSRGDIVALDVSNSGSIRWMKNILKGGQAASEVIHLSIKAGELTVVLADGSIITLHVPRGNILSQRKSSKTCKKIIELPGTPVPAVITVSTNGKPEIFSEVSSATPIEGTVLVSINEEGEAIGWSIGSSIKKVWTLRPDNGGKVVDVISRPAHDPVASIGQVLGDRSVLYKYINPNLALITSLSPSALTVYIVDAVTGAVLHTATHEGVLPELPISAIASANKVVYSFSSKDPADGRLSSQIIVSDLFESENPNDRGLLQARTNYSSFSPDAGAKPYILSIAFTTAEPLSALTVSQTGQGITSRQVLAYLAQSQSLIGIPNDILNTRRPIDRDPTSTEMEEGLMKYSPILELDPKLMFSHSREVLGIKEVMAAPTLLESTSSIFAFGHDIFGTQLAPSNTFDVLGKTFKRIQLVLTVVALYAGVLALRPLARRKMVERNWL